MGRQLERFVELIPEEEEARELGGVVADASECLEHTLHQLLLVTNAVLAELTAELLDFRHS